MQAGYSSRPLASKLGIKAGMRLTLCHAPEGYLALLDPLPERLNWQSELTEGLLDFIQYFSTSREALEADFSMLKRALRPTGMLWISWPKRTAKIPTDLDGNSVREFGLAHGLVDVKVAAVDHIWSGLKFVYRLADRPTEYG